MRFPLPLALVCLTSLATASGRVIRVEDRRGREVFVPSGTFVMGISTADDDVSTLEQECALAFEQRDMRDFPTPSGDMTTFCGLYSKQLEATKDTVLDDDGHPLPRKVFLSAFALDRDEVTVAEYRTCIAAGACPLDPLIAGDERYIAAALPLVNETWFEAQQFCRWRGGRLPTEAEWERAARGDDGRRWPWGGKNRDADFNHGKPRDLAMREVDRVAWVGIPTQFLGDPDDGDGTAILAPPGSYPWGEGPYGTRDQAGNVAEWTADTFGGISSSLATDDKALGYNGLGSINPRRDGSANDPKVVRGGSWRQPAFLGRANVRDPYNVLYVPDGRFSHIGFRCARSTD
ncbi:MAG: formylglycine-generating enzyme family protein [Kofleriaceae bacterium]